MFILWHWTEVFLNHSQCMYRVSVWASISKLQLLYKVRLLLGSHFYQQGYRWTSTATHESGPFRRKYGCWDSPWELLIITHLHSVILPLSSVILPSWLILFYSTKFYWLTMFFITAFQIGFFLQYFNLLKNNSFGLGI